MKNVAVLTKDGEFALFFRPHPGEFDSSGVPTHGNLPSKAKKMLMPGGEPRWGGEGGWGSSLLGSKISPVGAFPCLPYAFSLLIWISVESMTSPIVIT